MNRGGHYLNKQAIHVIRIAGFAVPLGLVFYGVLAAFDIADSTRVGDAIWFNLTLIGWIALSLTHMFIDNYNLRTMKWIVITYHTLIMPYILFVSGFLSPFLFGWLILMLASYIYFGKQAALMSSVALVAMALVEILVTPLPHQEVVEITFTLIVLLIIGYSLFALTRIQEVDWRAFVRNQEKEELERNKVSAIINNLTDAVVCTDADGIIELYNAATLNLIDTNESLVGKRIDDCIRIHTVEHKRVRLGTGLGNTKSKITPLHRDDLVMVVDESNVRIEMTRMPIRAGFQASVESRQNDFIFTFRDVTHTKSLEDEKDEFISVVSHELRTPIAIAEGTLSNLEVMMGRDNIAKPILKQNTKAAHEQVVFLAKMVNDLSTLSRAERGVADATELIDVESMMSDLYREYEPRASHKNLQLDLDVTPHPGYINASPLYVKELLQNFITNALKYTKEGTITMSVRKDAGNVWFAVRDSGIGISKTDQQHIFDKFYRSEDFRTRETRGTGLGLYVSAKLAHKIGTEIRVKSRLNHGSEFSFSLPVAQKTKGK